MCGSSQFRADKKQDVQERYREELDPHVSGRNPLPVPTCTDYASTYQSRLMVSTFLCDILRVLNSEVCKDDATLHTEFILRCNDIIRVRAADVQRNHKNSSTRNRGLGKVSANGGSQHGGAACCTLGSGGPVFMPVGDRILRCNVESI